METKSSSITIADLCDQYKLSNIVVNRDYQRSSKIWPVAAKSYLIDTILSGYPVPKLAMYQKLDLVNRRTIREIVDGQQRTLTIVDFYNDKLKLSGSTPFKGKTFSTLHEDLQRKFLEYGLTIDIFVGATESDIRQVFRRINSYNVPLNPEEQRHAKYQGRLKWFVVEFAEKYTQPLKNMGVFTESAISRMADMKFYSEICYAMLKGLDHSQDAKIDRLYSENDEEFSAENSIREQFGEVLTGLISAQPVYGSELMKPYIFYSLVLALFNRAYECEPLRAIYEFSNRRTRVSDRDVEILMNINAVLEEKSGSTESERKFLEGSGKATNRKIQREDRFRFFCERLDYQ